MFTASPDMRAALDVVRETDPALYERMRQPAWRVSTDMHVLTYRPDFMGWLFMTSDALGVTQREGIHSGRRLAVPRVWVNGDLTGELSTREDIPLRYVQAAVIAHEFCHVIQPDMIMSGSMEADAFDAGDAFIGRLPEPYASRLLEVSARGRSDEAPGSLAAMMYTGDYSRRPLPYGAGTTQGMTQRHYQALADTLRNVRNATVSKCQADTVDLIASTLAARLAQGNDRFRTRTFLNAVRDVARQAGNEVTS